MADVRGGDPVQLGSCLFDLESKLQFEAWVSLHKLGMLADREITFDTDAGSFRLASVVESEEPRATTREEELDG